jgi:hypothetical protein
MSGWNGGEFVDFHIVRDRKTVNLLHLFILKPCYPTTRAEEQKKQIQ